MKKSENAGAAEQNRKDNDSMLQPNSSLGKSARPLVSRILAMVLALLAASVLGGGAAADAAADRVTIAQQGSVVRIENARVSVSYDLSKGTFNATDKRSAKAVIANAHARIGDWPANAADTRHEWKSRTVRDDLGKGKTLAIRSSREGQPRLLLEITLYQEHGFAVLAGGLENTLDREIQLKEFHPLEGGEILPGVPAGGPAIIDAKTLNAPSGARDTRVTAGPFRVTPNNLMLTFTDAGARRTIVAGGLTYHEFLKSVRTSPTAGSAMQAASAPSTDKGEKVFLDLRAADPVGKRVDPGHSYLPDDRFYVDFTTPDPFEALELYGRQVRLAQKARPNPYDFPTVCSWYAGVWNTKGAQDHPEKSRYGIATTKGQVEEMDYIKSIGFLNYSRVALRLVPDNYTDNNMNGWWDDAHYQKEGFFVPPYETARKWGRAVRERGGLPGIYIQPTNYKGRGISRDFRLAFPHLMLGKSPDRMMDYTNPESQAHMRKVYANLRSGGVATIMFDYCDEMLAWDEAAPWDKAWGGEFGRGGLDDKYATASSSYRTMLRLAKEGLGPESWVHERALGNPGNDVALGISDSQRTEGDTYGIDPALIARSGLRWYKNRVVIAYDMDAKDLLAGWKYEGFQGTDQDGRRMLLTMSYVTASRLLLGNSFRDLPPQAIRDLQRVVPYHTAPQSARPIDAFIAEGWPRVYDFAVDPNWHQLTLLNDTTGTLEIEVPLSGDTAGGAMGLAPDASYYFYDFWNNRFAVCVKGTDRLSQKLRPGEARMLSVHRAEPNPQFLSTNRHLMQGYVDMPVRPKWEARKMTLSGTSNVVGGESYKIVIACNLLEVVSASATGAAAKVEACPGIGGLIALSLDSQKNASVRWKVVFSRNP